MTTCRETRTGRCGVGLWTTALLLSASMADAAVIPGDRFTFAIVGSSSSPTVFHVLGSGLVATFGTTTTFEGAGVDGLPYTISSSEVIDGTTVTDLFTITTPTSFLNSTTVNGTLISGLSFSVGAPFSGVGVATGADPVNLTVPLSTYTLRGHVVYGINNSTVPLPPFINLAGDALSFTLQNGITIGNLPISNLGVHEFHFSISYPVPEPATWGLMLLGLGLTGGVARWRGSAGR